MNPSASGSDPELPVWLALRRVHRAGVVMVGDGYLDHGRPVPGYVTDALDELAGAGLLALAEVDPAGQRRVAVADLGQARYLALCEQRRVESTNQAAFEVPAPQLGTTDLTPWFPVGRWLSDPRPPAPGG